MLAEPSTIALLGLGFFLLILCILAILVFGCVAIIFLTSRKKKNEAPPATPSLPNSTQVVPPKCPKCGATMAADSPEGLCPRCLIALNLATQTDIPGEAAAAKAPPGPPLPVGDIAKLFPQLEILECLGRGGMGAVYKARQPRLDRIVALKIISPEKQGNQKFAERFEREARALAKLHHPNIVTVYDFGETQGNFYLLMEYVDGLTLRQLLQTRKLAPEEALAIVPKICEALQYAHGLGIVHRDIKPENVLMDKAGRVKIADFGIAKIIGDGERTNLTEEQAIGTPHYMSPEQIERPQTVDHRADIYSLGVVFYEMLTGELPLGKFQPPSKKVHVDVRLDEIVLRALEKEPERRYQQASEVKTRVENIAGTALMMGLPELPAKKPDHFWRWFAVICLSVMVSWFLLTNLVHKESPKPMDLDAGNLPAADQIGRSDFYVGERWLPEGDAIEIAACKRQGEKVTIKGHYALSSHVEATLKLGITSDATTPAPEAPAQSLHIKRGSGEFELTMTNSISGLPHVSMYAHGHSFAAVYFGDQDEAAREEKIYDAMMNDPVAIWLANGNANDSAHDHNGEMENADFTHGVVGNAFSFQPENHPYGTYSGIKIPDDPAFAVVNEFSIEGWVRPTGLGYLIFWRGDQRAGTDPYYVGMDNTGLEFGICNEANIGDSITAPISYNQWWHFAAVFDNGTMRLYTNGVLAVEATTAIRPFANLMASAHPGLGIGNLNDGQNNFPFRGDIDDIAFYNRALSPLEVRFNYELGFKTRAGKAPVQNPTPVVSFQPIPAPPISYDADLQKSLDDAEAQLIKSEVQLQQLAGMDNEQLRQALPDVTEDLTLNKLLQDLSDTQLQVASMNVTMGSNSPARMSLNARMDDINEAIDARMKGIIAGLKIQAEAQRAELEQLQELTAANGNLTNANQIAVLEKRFYELTAQLNRSGPGANEAENILAEQPPVVVETFPAAGARNVAPGETEIRVRFSKEMMDSWSWSTAWENSIPVPLGPAQFLDDHRTCVMKVLLKPGKTYAWWLNSAQFKGFKDKAGLPAVPYLFCFQTRPATNAAEANESNLAPSVEDLAKPRVVSVSPADGASDVETQQDIRIRFNQPMNPNDVSVNWLSGGFLTNSEPRYDAAKNEFVIPVQLLAGRTNRVEANWANRGFRNMNSVPAAVFKWQFTTKALASRPDAPKPRVVGISPAPGKTLPVLTMLELTFDQPMTLERGLPYLRGTGGAFVPAMLPDFHYDSTGKRLTVPLLLPPDNETKLTLEGFYSADGAASDPVVIRCEIGTNNYSREQLNDISVAAKDPRLEQLLSYMQTARRRLTSGTETVIWTSAPQINDSWRGITVQPATFRWQGTNQFYEDISDIMGGKAFILGTDGKSCWMYANDEYSGRRFDSSPMESIADFRASIADPFNLAQLSVQSAISKGKLMYDGPAPLDGHDCYRVKSWLVEQTGNDYMPAGGSKCEWWIDAGTYLPVQVTRDNEIYKFRYEGLNRPQPPSAFEPPDTQGTHPDDWYPLGPGETRFFTIKDGSDGQMSGRIGKRGPNNSSTDDGLN